MKTCTNCGAKHFAKGLCRVHYYQQPHQKEAAARRYQAQKSERTASARANYEANKERCRAANAAWAVAHPDKMRAYKEEYRERHREEENAKRRARYHSDLPRSRERARVNTKAYYERYPEKTQEWRKANPERARAAVTNRRARLRTASGTHTGTEIEALFARQKGCCAICRIKLPKSYHKDHIQPLVRGGANDIGNIQLLCPPCNQTKSDRDPVEYMQERGLLL